MCTDKQVQDPAPKVDKYALVESIKDKTKAIVKNEIVKK